VKAHAPVIALAASVGLCVAAFRYLAFDSFSNDHYQHLARAQQILMGALPVRDYAESGLPLTAGLSALAQLVFGPGLHAEVIWIAVAFGLAAACGYVAGVRASGSLLLPLSAVAVTVMAYPVSYSYPKLLPYAAAFVAAAVYAAAPSLPRLAGLAAAVVFGFLLRHDHGFILAVGAAAAVLACAQPPRRTAVAMVQLAVLGVLLASPYLIWVQWHQGLASYLAEGIALSRREAEKASWGPPAFQIDRSKRLFGPVLQPWGPIVNVRWAPTIPAPYRESREREHGLRRLEQVGPHIWQYELRRWSSGTLEGIVRDPAVVDTHGIERSEFYLEVPAPGPVARLLMNVPAPAAGLRPAENSVATLYYLAWLLPATAALLLWLTWGGLSRETRSLAVMAIVVQLLMCRSMLRDPLATRVRDVVIPFAVFLPFFFAAVRQAGWRWPGKAGGYAFAVAVLVLAGWASAAAGSLGIRLEQAGLEQGWRGVLEHARSLRADMQPPQERTGPAPPPIVGYLASCTPPGSRLLTMTFAPELLFFSGRGFAGGHESLLPRLYNSPRQLALMLARLRREDVQFVIMDTETQHEMWRDYPPVAAWVQGRYREVARFPVASEKRLIVLADQTRPVTGSYGDDRLPCFSAATTEKDL
jgi:hypothetical protein